ncbi:hypothetical protein PAMP_001597 [Pampus punctatissimus]
MIKTASFAAAEAANDISDYEILSISRRIIDFTFSERQSTVKMFATKRETHTHRCDSINWLAVTADWGSGGCRCLHSVPCSPGTERPAERACQIRSRGERGDLQVGYNCAFASLLYANDALWHIRNKISEGLLSIRDKFMDYRNINAKMMKKSPQECYSYTSGYKTTINRKGLELIIRHERPAVGQEALVGRTSRTFSRRVPLMTDEEIKEEFKRITTVHLKRTFLSKLDSHTTKLVEIFRKKGGIAGTNIKPMLDSLSEVNVLINLIATSNLDITH